MNPYRQIHVGGRNTAGACHLVPHVQSTRMARCALACRARSVREARRACTHLDTLISPTAVRHTISRWTLFNEISTRGLKEDPSRDQNDGGKSKPLRWILHVYKTFFIFGFFLRKKIKINHKCQEKNQLMFLV